MEKKINLTIGFLFFLGGCSIYAFARKTSPYFISGADFLINLPDIFIFSFPVFFHTISMIFISYPFISSKKSSVFFLSFFWTSIEIIFELGQKYPKFLNSFFSSDIFLPLNNYFKNGTYDPKDIGMAVAGGITGLAAIILYQNIISIFKKGDNLCQTKTKT
jgi:hypothetical protein